MMVPCHSKHEKSVTPENFVYSHIPKDGDRIPWHITEYHGGTRPNYVQHESALYLASHETRWDIVSWFCGELELTGT